MSQEMVDRLHFVVPLLAPKSNLPVVEELAVERSGSVLGSVDRLHVRQAIEIV